MGSRRVHVLQPMKQNSVTYGGSHQGDQDVLRRYNCLQKEASHIHYPVDHSTVNIYSTYIVDYNCIQTQSSNSYGRNGSLVMGHTGSGKNSRYLWAKYYVVVMVNPTQGHVIPAMELAQCLVEQGVKVTSVRCQSYIRKHIGHSSTELNLGQLLSGKNWIIYINLL